MASTHSRPDRGEEGSYLREEHSRQREQPGLVWWNRGIARMSYDRSETGAAQGQEHQMVRPEREQWTDWEDLIGCFESLILSAMGAEE